MKIYSLYDKKAEKFGTPFTTINHNVAIREFAMACNEPKSPMFMYPEDIELTYIGDFDEITGTIKAEKPITLTCAKEFRKETKNVEIPIGQTNGNN